MLGFRSQYSTQGTQTRNEVTNVLASGYATSLYTGDPIAITGGAMVAATPGAQNIAGIFDGVKIKNSAGIEFYRAYWPASTATRETVAGYEPINDSVKFAITADGVVPQTALGQYANWAFGTPNANSGQSGAVLTVASLNAAATGRDLKVVGIQNFFRTDGIYNSWGVANTQVLVAVIPAANQLVG